jgi:non-canonical purine NTP pyrophosphatase (RdgB/HAM1 family)
MNVFFYGVLGLYSLHRVRCAVKRRGKRNPPPSHAGKDEVVFVTSSDRKIKHLDTYLKLHGLDKCHIKAADINLAEIQGEPREVALRKARDAYAVLKRPLLVEDSAFHIPALRGFPGTYARYVMDTVGPCNVEKMLTAITADEVAAPSSSDSSLGQKSLENARRCHFSTTLVYVDRCGHCTTFESQNTGYFSQFPGLPAEDRFGHEENSNCTNQSGLPKKIRERQRRIGWGRWFVSDDSPLPIPEASLNITQHHTYRKARAHKSAYCKFVQWFAAQ